MKLKLFCIKKTKIINLKIIKNILKNKLLVH